MQVVEAAAAGTVPMAQRGRTEQEVTLPSCRSFVIASVWDCSKSLPICSLPSPWSQDECERVCEHGAQRNRVRGGGCWLLSEPTFS